MLSRLRSNVLFKLTMFVLIFSVTSCSYFFDPKEEPREVDIPSSDTQCLTQTSKVFSRFFSKLDEETSLDDSLTNQVSCLQGAVVKFSSYVKSGEGDGQIYNAQEILNILNIFFNEENLPFDLTLGFIENSLKIKEFLIGGNDKSLTKVELRRVEKFVEVFGEIFLNIRPYRKILFDHQFKLERTLKDREKFDDAFFLLRDSLNDLLNLVEKWGGEKPFDLSSAGDFLLSTYYGNEFNERKPYLSLFIEFKKMVLNDDHPFVKRKDLDFLIHQSLRAYHSIFEYNHFVEDGNLFNSLGALASFIVKIPQLLSHGDVLDSMTYDSLGRIYERGAETLIYAARRGPKGRIAVDKIEGLLSSMEKVGYLGKYLTSNSLTFFISNLMNGWMVDESLKVTHAKTGTHSYQPYFTEAKISYVLSHINGWRERQAFINKAIKGKAVVDLNKLDTKNLSSGVKDWIRVMKKVNLKHWAGIGSSEVHNEGKANSFRLLFTKKDQRLDYRELTANNSIHTEILFFMQPFQTKGRDIFDYSISEEQTQSIYELMRHIGIELAFMDSRIYDTGKRAFGEANLFTTLKKADKKINIYEGFEIMNYMYNSGILSNEIYNSLPENLKLEELDVLRKSLIDTKGFRKFLLENFMHYFQQLPGLQKHWGQLSPKGRKEFIEVLEKASRGGVITENPYDMGAIRILVAVTYYLESIFYNFEKDDDGDNIAYGAELVAAEKHFHDYVLRIAEKNTNKNREVGDPDWEKFDEDHVDNVFYSILYYKKLPDPESWNNFWTVGAANSRQKISRSDALYVFSILADVSRKGAIERIEKFLMENQEKLLHEVEILKEVPKCQKRKMLFCQWARVLQCNTDVYEHLFKQMPVSKNRFHNDENLTAKENVKKTLIDLAEWMRKDDILLLTKCGYPAIRRNSVVSGAGSQAQPNNH